MIPTRSLSWTPAYRIIPTRFPSIYLWDRVTSSDQFALLNEIEALTNPHSRNEIGQLSLVPESEQLFGPGNGCIMAAFTHLNQQGSRFSDGSYGVFYAAQYEATAIEETKYHITRFMLATNEAPQHLQMRLLKVAVNGSVHDLSVGQEAAIFDPDNYSSSQALAKKLRAEGSNGVLYPSVRDQGQPCIAAFKTNLLRGCFHEAYLEYHFDGTHIDYFSKVLNTFKLPGI